MPQPMQPVVLDHNGNPRFYENAVVKWLLEEISKRGITLTEIVQRDFPDGDLEQFYQLIGYSVGGYCELTFLDGRSCAAAVKRAKALGFPWQQGAEAVAEWKMANDYPVD